jgi:hypothetical protein
MSGIRCAHDQDWLTCSTCLADCGASPCTTCVVQRRKAEAVQRAREALWAGWCPNYGQHRVGIQGECTCGARPPVEIALMAVDAGMLDGTGGAE